jgi:hypothetical protein
MFRAEESPSRFIDTPEYRRLTYRMFRTEGVRRSDGRLYRLGAVAAWRLACQFPSPSLARRYAEALS